MHPRRRLLAIVATALAATVAVPGAASAAVTIGAPLNLPANAPVGCDRAPSLFGFLGPGSVATAATSCTWLGADRISNPTWTSQVPRGQWVVVRVRVRAGASTGPMSAVILGNLRSQAGAGGGTICCRGMVESEPFTPAANAVTEVNTRLPAGNTVSVVTGEPIETVDYLALNVLAAGVALPVHDTGVYTDMGTVRSSAFWPAIRTGQEQALSSGYFGMYPLIQADLEPDADGDGFGDETQDSCPTSAQIRSAPVARTAQCPAAANPAPGTGPTAIAGLRGGTRSLVLRRGRRGVTLPIACPAGSAGRCAGTVSGRTVRRIGSRRVTLGTRRFTAAAGRTVNTRLLLPASVRRALARRRTLALDLTITQRSPIAGTTTARVTLRRR
jgi:hypothetical protein